MFQEFGALRWHHMCLREGMRALSLVLFFAFATWIVGCSAPDVVGTQMRGGDVGAGDDDDEPTPAKKKKGTTPTGATETPTNSGATPTTGDAPVTPPPTTTTTPAETTPTTTPDPTPAPEPAPAPAPVVTPAATKFTTTANLNLRTGPSTSDSIILTMPKGSEIEAVEETPTDNWYHVTFNGQDGWASGSYLEEI